MSLPDLQMRLTANDAAARAALDRARAGLRGLKTESQGASGAMQTMTRSSGAMRASIQNAAFQVGDFAVQVSAGTSAVRAMSMQLPQLLGAFGVFGAVAGAAFAALAPLVAKLFEGGDAADEQAAKLEGLSGSLSSMRGQISGLGDLQERLNSLQRAQAGASAAGASAVIANTQKEFDARKQLIEVERTLLTLRSQDAIQALNNLRDQQEMARSAAQERLRTLGPGATGSRLSDAEGYAGPGPSMADIQSAVGEDALAQMRERSTQIKRLEAELALVEIAADEASAALDGVFSAPGDAVGGGGGTGGSGGGGGGRRTTSPRSEQIRVMSEELQNLTELTRGQLGEQLGAWSDYFSGLGSMMQSENDKMLRIAKAFGAAQTLINAWKAYGEVLSDPSFVGRPWARIAAAAQVLAAGLGAVNAIKSVNAGGGGGKPNAAGSTTAAPNQPLEAIVRLQGPFASALAGEIGPIFDMLREEAGDRGLSPRVVGIA